MFREPRPGHEPAGPGRDITLPPGALEVGLGYGDKKGAKKRDKAEDKARAAARTMLHSEVTQSPTTADMAAVKPETVSMWQKLLRGGAAEPPEASEAKLTPADGKSDLEAAQVAAAAEPANKAPEGPAGLQAMEFPLSDTKARPAEQLPQSAEVAPVGHEQGGAPIEAESQTAQAEHDQPPLAPPPLETWMREPSEPPLAATNREAASPTDYSEAAAGRAGDEPPGPPVPPVGSEGSPDDDPQPARSGAATTPLAERLTPITAVPASETVRSGYERTSADVTRAAWLGVALGWFVGRRGKNNAVQRAVAAVEDRYRRLLGKEVSARQSSGVAERAYAQSGESIAPEAVPAAVRIETVRERTAPNVDWTRSETAPKVMPSTMERLAAAPLTETLALPAAAVAARNVAEAAGGDGRDGMVRSLPEVRAEASLSKGEMLQLAKSIKVEGVSLAEIYESKQIDERGLRAVVEAYLRGGDFKSRLNVELVEKQKSFERDPMARRRSEGAARQALGQASAKVAASGVMAIKATQQAAAKAAGSLKSGAEKAQSTVGGGSDNQLWLGVTAIAIIWALILFLLLGGR